MIVKFNSSAPATKTGGSSNTLITLAALAIAGFAIYKFVYVPYKNKKNEEALKAFNGESAEAENQS